MTLLKWLMLAGHYTAFCAVDGDEWYEFDDRIVGRAMPAAVVTPAAYVLFYRRRTCSTENLINFG